MPRMMSEAQRYQPTHFESDDHVDEWHGHIGEGKTWKDLQSPHGAR